MKKYFENSTFSPEVTLNALRYLGTSSGADGMIGGQIIDMEGERRPLNADEVKKLQEMKTGALIRAAAIMGCILGKATDEQIASATAYAENIGLAFQIRDDILNVEGDAEIMGKDVGNDEESGKSTFVKLWGLDECKTKVSELTDNAIEEVKKLPESEFLIWVANMLVSRNN